GMQRKKTGRLILESKSYDDFFERNKYREDRGKNFERLVQLFLQTDSEYANNNLVKVWMHDEVPAAVRREINLPNRDEGDDLIARDVRGRYWMIQAKHKRDPMKAVTLRDIATSQRL